MFGHDTLFGFGVGIQGPDIVLVGAAQHDAVMAGKHVAVAEECSVVDRWLGQQDCELSFYGTELLVFKQRARAQTSAVDDCGLAEPPDFGW